MSKIYEALIQAGRRSSSRAASRRTDSSEQAVLRLSQQHNRLQWKITGTVATVMVVFGLLLVIAANQFMGRALRSENDRRAVAITTNLSDAAAGPLMAKNILELYAVLTKYARLNGVAYAFIEDTNGQIVAHSLKPLPPELKPTLTPDERKQVSTRTVTLQSKTVDETRVPILEGQLGAVHLGMWAEGVTTELASARLPFLELLIAMLVFAVCISVFIVRAMLAPLRTLTEVASETSADDLTAPLENRVAR